MSKAKRRTFEPNEVAFEALESRLALAADFVVSMTPVVNAFERRADAEMIRTTVTIRNNGDMFARGGGTLEFFFSSDQSFDPDEDLLFEVRRIGKLPGRGASTTVKLDMKEPTLVNPPAPFDRVAPGEYNIFARLVLNQPSQESSATNNVATSLGFVNVAYEFGMVNGKNRPFTWTQPDGSKVTVKFDGAGQGNLDSSENGMTLVVTFATRLTNLHITTDRKTTLNFSQIILPQGLDSLRAQKVTLTGLISIQNFGANITLGGIERGSVSISGGFRPITLSLGKVTDSVVTSTVGLTSLGAVYWRDTDGFGDFVRAPYIERLTSGGDFAASVTVTSGTSEGFGLERVKIKGMIGGAWSIAGGSTIFEAGSTDASFRANFTGIVDLFRTSGDMQGLFASPLLERFEVGRDLIGAQVLSGYSLGADLQIGGTGNDADQFRNGVIDRVLIRRNMINSIVAAGLVSTDGVLLNDDDSFVTNPAGAAINRIQVHRLIQNSFFVAPTLPSQAILRLKLVDVVENPAFINDLS